MRFSKIGVEEDGSFLFGSGKQMALSVERDGDRRVPHEGLQRLRVHAGRDHRAREGVTAFVRGMGRRPAGFQALFARRLTLNVANGVPSPRPKTRPCCRTIR